MKYVLPAIVFVFSWSLLHSQETIELDSCYLLARENYPGLVQSEMYKEMNALQMENIKINYLPDVNLYGQATYQSDVPGFDIALPGITLPRAPKDQYRAYAEIRQLIWGGGTTAASAALEDALLQNQLDELEVELYKLNEQVAQAFFTVIVAGKQLEVLNAQKEILDSRYKSAESAVKHGAAESSSLSVIKAEIINLEQNELQLASVKTAAAGVLSILTGMPVGENAEFRFHDSPSDAELQGVRPEVTLFRSRIDRLDKQMTLIDKSRNPVLSGFGQVGYGRPGLNMLNDEFDSFYLVGAVVSWNAFDWKESSRKKQVIQLQQEMMVAGEATFEQNISILLARQQEEITRLEKVLKTDSELVALRSEITESAASKLENETITTSEFIREMQAETIAKLNYELHKIQLSEAREKYSLIRGKNLN